MSRVSCDCRAHRCAAARQFDREKAGKELGAYRRNGPGVTTRGLIEGLHAASAQGTLLDIGAGSGALTFELLGGRVSRATCVDLAAGSIAVAQEEAKRRQLADRIAWHEGDFVELASELPPADIVTLDRVVCCYPLYAPLLGRAAEHSRRWLALSVPRDRWYVRWGLWIENGWRKLRRDSFQAFVHSTEAIESLLREAGFELVSRSKTFVWQASVYVRRLEKEMLHGVR